MNYKYVEELALKCKENDAYSKEKLIEEFKPFILNISKSTFIDGYTFDDIEHECYKILLSCLSHYNSSSHRFVAYATISIKNNINDLIRKSMKRKSAEGQNALIFDECLDSFLESGKLDVHEEACRNILNETLKKSLSALTPQEREFIDFIYFQGKTIKAYSEMKKKPYFNLFHMKKKILIKIETFIKSQSMCI